jgi:flagellar basal-body rod modification protein FlgD
MTSVTSATAATAASTGAAAGNPTLFGDFNTFLTMLTTQLTNQDPVSPMDTNAMTQQLTQFASVEQQMKANTTLTKLLELQQSSDLLSSAPLIGKSIEFDSDQVALQNGAAELWLPAGMGRTATITVSDQKGRALLAQQVPMDSAAKAWRWDGRDAAGTAQPAGAYKVSVTDQNGQAVGFTATGTVSAAQQRDGKLQLMVGKLAVDYDKIRAVAGQ